MLLLNGDMISAPELSKIFGVTTRTIHRDIKTISRAGIPLTTLSDPNGGIGINEKFIIEKNISSDSDISSIVIKLIEEYPGIVDNNDYILAKYKSEAAERKKSDDKDKSTVIKVTIMQINDKCECIDPLHVRRYIRN